MNPALNRASRRTGRDPHAGYASGSAGIELCASDDSDELPGWFSQPPGKRLDSEIKVAELLDLEDIVLGMPAKGKRSALARIAAQLGNRVGVGQGPVLAAMLRREHLSSTAIGYGIAIPHARLDGISTPAAMLATMEHPVWFGAPDNDPVDLLLAFAWPKSDGIGFLPALAHCCRLLRHPELRDRIRASKTSSEVLAWMGTFEERSTAAPGGNAI